MPLCALKTLRACAKIVKPQESGLPTALTQQAPRDPPVPARPRGARPPQPPREHKYTPSMRAVPSRALSTRAAAAAGQRHRRLNALGASRRRPHEEACNTRACSPCSMMAQLASLLVLLACGAAPLVGSRQLLEAAAARPVLRVGFGSEPRVPMSSLEDGQPKGVGSFRPVGTGTRVCKTGGVHGQQPC